MAKRVNVTPADREAWIEYEDFDGAFADQVRTGVMDATEGLQAFARHRIAEREACAMVAEEHVAIVDHVEEAALIAGAGRDIAAAIRARS